MYCRMFSTIPDLHRLNANSTYPSYDNRTCLQTLPNVAMAGVKLPPIENHCIYNLSTNINDDDDSYHSPGFEPPSFYSKGPQL